jgi:hypothetical protein
MHFLSPSPKPHVPHIITQLQRICTVSIIFLCMNTQNCYLFASLTHQNIPPTKKKKNMIFGYLYLCIKV